MPAIPEHTERTERTERTEHTERAMSLESAEPSERAATDGPSPAPERAASSPAISAASSPATSAASSPASSAAASLAADPNARLAADPDARLAARLAADPGSPEDASPAAGHSEPVPGDTASQPEDLALAVHAWLGQVMQVSMHGFIRYTKDIGLSMSQAGALFQIHRQKMCGVGGVGEDLGITSAAASQMIDRLVQQELLQREEDPKDRRGKVLSLTPKGEAVVRQAATARQTWIGRLVEDLDEEERILVAKAMSLLARKAKILEEASK